MLARAAAAECGASFLSLSPSSIMSKWLGDGVRSVRAAFALATKLAPCVVFIDEVDALLGKRRSGEHEAVSMLACLLDSMVFVLFFNMQPGKRRSGEHEAVGRLL